jgi:hypothetical protein
LGLTVLDVLLHGSCSWWGTPLIHGSTVYWSVLICLFVYMLEGKSLAHRPKPEWIHCLVKGEHNGIDVEPCSFKCDWRITTLGQ